MRIKKNNFQYLVNPHWFPAPHLYYRFYIPFVNLFSPLGNSKVLEKLMEKVGRQYIKSNKAKEFLFDLLQLDTPKLFQHTPQSSCESDTDSPANKFTAFLRGYISMFAIRGHLLDNYSRMMVSKLFKLMLILMMYTVLGVVSISIGVCFI